MLIHTEKIDIKNPLKSENIWAASLNIAKDEASIPPTISAMRNIKAIIDAIKSFSRTFLVILPTSGRSYTWSWFSSFEISSWTNLAANGV